MLAATREAAAGLLVTKRRVSMGGEHDSIKAALQAPRTVSFRKVAMQPGMPQGCGTAGDLGVPILMLPGNPVSAFISFCLFAQPAVRAQQGLAPEKLRTGRAVRTAPVRSAAGKRSFASGALDPGRGAVTPASGHSSHHLTALARASALIIVPEPVTSLAAGDPVGVLELPS